MTGPRIQVDGVRPVPIRPAASPVDSFARTSEGSQLAQLGDALREFSPTLAQLAGVVNEKRTEAAREEAKALARRTLVEEGRSFQEAIKAGEMHPSDSPHFRAFLREEAGQIMAQRWQQSFRVAAVNALKDSASLSDFDALVQQTTKEFLKDVPEGARDRFFEQGFGDTYQGLVDGERRRFVEEAKERILDFSDEQLHATVFGRIQQGLSQGLTVEQLGKTITDELDLRFEANPVGGTRANIIAAAAIAAFADRMDEPRLLEVLDHVMTGPPNARSPLANTKTGAKLLEDTRERISDQVQQRYVRTKQRETSERESTARDILTEATTRFQTTGDKYSVRLEDLEVRMNAVDPTKVEALGSVRDFYVGNTYRDDPQRVAVAMSRIHTDEEASIPALRAQVTSLLASRFITPDRYRQLMGMIQEREEAGGVSRFAKDPWLGDFTRRVEKLFVSEFGFEGTETKAQATNAVLQLRQEYIEWRLGAGKEAAEPEIIQWGAEAIRRHFIRVADATSLTDFLKAPVGGRPMKPDPQRQLVAHPSVISKLDQEFSRLESAFGENSSIEDMRGIISAPSIIVLMYAGFDVTSNFDVAEIRQFIDAQKSFAASARWSSSPSDSTSH